MLSKSWHAVKTEWAATLKYTLGMMFVPFLLFVPLLIVTILIVGPEELNRNPLPLLPSYAVMILAMMWFWIGLVKYLMNKSMPGSTKGNWPTMGELGNLIIVGILSCLAIVAGLVLFILPGIWIGVMLGFAMYFVLQDKKNPIEALGASWNLVKGRWWATFARLFVPNLVYQLVLGAIVWAVIMIFVAIGFGIVGLGSAMSQRGEDLAAFFATAGPGLLGLLGLFVLVMLVLQFVMTIVLYIAQVSISVETYKSLRENAPKA